jgi:hypothetical protein
MVFSIIAGKFCMYNIRTYNEIEKDHKTQIETQEKTRSQW